MTQGASAKPYSLSFEVREKYLYAYVVGEHDNLAICTAYWGEIAQELKRLGLRKVMIVEDIPEPSALTDVYNLAARLGNMGFRGIDIAFVDRFSSHQDQNDFGVLVASNRGLHGMAFDNELDAEVWLLLQP